MLKPPDELPAGADLAPAATSSSRPLPPTALGVERLALLTDADLCVKCGLCLPHCPTYGLSRHEADGPRGRIALAQGLATGALSTDDRAVQRHLDGCLSCRACEKVCPAKVPYGRVFDAAQHLLASPRRTALPRLFAAVLVPRLPRTLLRWLLWLASRLPVLRRAAAPRLLRGLPERVWAWAPDSETELPASMPAGANPAAEVAPPATTAAEPEPVALFAGCVGDLLEREALADAARLLRALGHAVSLPAAQTCCGALHQHAGAAAQAARLAAANARAFAGARRVLALTPGCGAALRDLDPSLPVEDLCAYLAQRLDAQPLRLRPPVASLANAPAGSESAARPQRVAVHVACTQAHVLDAGGAVTALLARLPGVELLPLAPRSGCCGAAGLQFLRQPGQAEALLAPKLDAAATMAPDVIASANIGCSLHLAAGLRGRGLAAPVVHPVTLLARALALDRSADTQERARSA